MSSRKMLALVLIGLLGVTFMPAARADTDTKNAVRIAGQVTKIDGKALTIASTAGQDTVITCTDATKISRDGGTSAAPRPPATFADLQVGQQVRAYYSKVDNTAFAVIIAQAPAPAPAPTPAP